MPGPGAAIKEVEPTQKFVGENDIGEKMVFTVADQKALLTEIYMETNSSFVGSRNNEKKGDWVFDKDHKISKTLKDSRYPQWGTNYDAFWDITPRQFFLIFTNYIGIRRMGLVIDRYTGSQVWNQPMAGYRILPILPNHIRSPEERDGKTVYPVLVRIKMFWAEDGVGELEVSESFDINRTTDEFKYKEKYNKHYSGRSLAFYLFFDEQLKVSKDGKKVRSAGKIVGDGIWYHQTEEGAGEWKSVIENSHPDFIWLPNEIISNTKNRNRPPTITEDRVRDIFGDKKEIKEEREKLENRVDNIYSLTKFKKLQKDILSFREKGLISDKGAVDLLINLKKNGSIFISNPSGFIRLVNTGLDLPSSYYKLQTSKFIAENMDFFFTLNPNVTSIVALQKEILSNSTAGTKTIDLVLRLKEKGLARIKKSYLFFKLLDIGVERPSKFYKKAMAAFFIGKIDKFMLLSPTVNEILSFQGLLFEMEAGFRPIYNLKEKALKSASRYQDYVALLDLGTTDPPKAYRQLVFNLAKENPFGNPDSKGILKVKAGTSFKTFIKNHQNIVRRLNYSYSDIINHKKAGLEIISHPDQLAELVSPRLTSVSVRYQRLIDNFISSNINTMIEKVHPQVTHLIGLHKFVFDHDTDMDIKKAALKVFINEKEIPILLDPGKIEVSEDYLDSISDFMAKNISVLKALGPSSLEKWLTLTNFSRSVSAYMAVKENALDLIKDPEDLGIIFGSSMVGNPTGDLKDTMDSFLQKNIEKMVAYASPSIEQLVALTDFASSLKGKISIKEAGFGRVKTLEEYAYLLDPYVDSPSKEYLAAIDKFKDSNPFKDENGKIVEVTYVTCAYQLKTRVIKMKKGQFLGSAYDMGLACNKAQKKCKDNRKWNWKCYKKE